MDKLDHVNFLTYQRIADLASLEIWQRANGVVSESEIQFVMTETYVRYIRELRLGDPLKVRTSLIAWDAKRFHLLHRLESAGNLACTVETMNLCFDPASRRVIWFTDTISGNFASWGTPTG